MSGIGLAPQPDYYDLPERKAAGVIDASVRPASAAPGIGLTSAVPAPVPAPPPAAAPAAPAPSLAQPAPAPATAPAPQQPEPLIDFHKNPLGAIGLVLSSVAAGINGTDSPVEKLKQQKLEQQAMAYKTASLALDTVDKVAAFAAKLPENQRQAAIDDLDAKFAPALGGFSIKTMVQPLVDGKIKNGAAKIAALKEMGLSPTALAGMDAETIDKVTTAYLDGKAKAAGETKTPEQIFTEAKARGAGERAGNPPKPDKIEHKFANVDGKNGYYTDDQLSTLAAGGHKISPATTTSVTMNNDQANAATFADRAHEAEGVLSKLDATQGGSLGGAVLSAVPGGNYGQSPDFQRNDQARRDFVNAVLRKESGAAISKDEFDNANKQYFTQPGDKPDVIAQKARNRATAIKGLARAAGPTYEQPVDLSLPKVTSNADYAKLPKGAEFIAPDGSHRKKP